MPFPIAGNILKRSSLLASRPLPRVHLRIRRGRAKHLDRPIHGPVYLIGRSADCDLVLGDVQMPDVHSYLFVNQQGVTLRRIGALPRLTVNSVPAERATLRHGDIIAIGNYEFELNISAASNESPRGQRPRGEIEGLDLVRKLLLDVRFGDGDQTIARGSQHYEH